MHVDIIPDVLTAIADELSAIPEVFTPTCVWSPEISEPCVACELCRDMMYP
jgi:hypothetical protein